MTIELNPGDLFVSTQSLYYIVSYELEIGQCCIMHFNFAGGQWKKLMIGPRSLIDYIDNPRANIKYYPVRNK